MSLKISQLDAITGIKKSETANFVVQTSEGTQRISFANLKKAMTSEYPFTDAVELDYTWADIKSMAQAGSFESDIRVGDFKTITVNGETAVMEVAGIDTEYKCGDTATGHHIDFISRDCLKDTVQWNTAGNNNGTADENNPYLAASISTYLTGTVYGWLPDDVKAVVSNKRALMEVRYTAGSTTVTDSTSWAWKDLGKVWLPSEVEVYGQTVWGNSGWSAGESSQYPIFRDGWAKRVKGAGAGGDRCIWWLRDAYAGSSTVVLVVNFSGNPYWSASYNTNYTIRVPLCFRIAA
jgi:hypothetical protein